ncbi:nucleotidyltransferase domain-containing protein [Kitasatospora sp. NBC_00240]|uniref:nucleotidyltransferase domain-containing protein n=1 Tax=Kitasatospora sp. NBC_00240 TaxID=2903567 RepID=UPI00225332AB|nr:nucleotidyltransferase domain-containing protein [Kitasatospora sp. NBC_00240]MCX5215271.1 nucleotidyltransferase domain-containing protein [Kitasatospora sp. NBC_00240]
MTRMSRASGGPQPLPEHVRPYLRELVGRTRGVCGAELVSILAVGSLALGDYRPGRSDVDVTVVVEPSVSGAMLRVLAGTLAHPRLPCPAAGLELVVYDRDFAGRASGRAGYLLDLNSGPLLTGRASFDPVPSPAFWYVIDRSVAHQAGLTLFGGTAREVIAPPTAADLLAAVRASVREHSEGEGHLADNRVLNGCRSVLFCRTGRWTAKRAAGHAIAAAEPGFRPIVEAALAGFERPRAEAVGLPAAEVRNFLAWVRERVDEPAGAVGR